MELKLNEADTPIQGTDVKNPYLRYEEKDLIKAYLTRIG